jgi:hypothetical protein
MMAPRHEDEVGVAVVLLTRHNVRAALVEV